MKILVCVKQIPDFGVDTVVKIDDSESGIVTDKWTTFRMNRFDDYAVEEAILIKEKFPDTRIEILTVGSSQADAVVRRGLGMGANHGIHIVINSLGYISPFLISSWIADYAKDKNYDLILTGVMSEDAMQGQVGPMLAEMLSLPCATATIAQTLAPETGTVRVQREIEGGYRDTLQLQLPALLTIQTGINQPRYPALSKVLKAKRAKLEIIDAGTLEQPEPRQNAVKMGYPEKTREGKVIEGNEEEKAAQLLDILLEKSLI